MPQSNDPLIQRVRRQQVAKIFHSGMERMLVVYLRSLGSAMEDALIVADPRPADAIHQAWHSGGAGARGRGGSVVGPG